MQYLIQIMAYDKYEFREKCHEPIEKPLQDGLKVALMTPITVVNNGKENCYLQTFVLEYPF